jgi:hypothetical protein
MRRAITYRHILAKSLTKHLQAKTYVQSLDTFPEPEMRLG